MKRLLAALLTMVLILTSCSGIPGLFKKSMTGDGNVLGRSYEMTGDPAYKIIIKDIAMNNYDKTSLIFDEALGDELVISTDENIFLSFDVDVNDIAKTITVSGDVNLQYAPTMFEITVGGLVSDINLSGGYNVDIKFDTVKRPVIKVAGAISGNVSCTDTEVIAFEIAGAVDLKLSGNTAEITADISGATDIKGYELSADIANVSIAGASEIELTVNNELYAGMSGASYIRYKGDGKIMKSDIAGLGEIIKVD